MDKVGILLLGHGSRADGANDGMYRVAEALRSRGDYDIVEVGFMIRNFPSIEDGAAACVIKGAKTVLLIPYFLHTGLHLIEDLPNAIPRLEKLHPGVRFALGQPMGSHPGLVDIVADRIEECRIAAERGVAIQGDAILQKGQHLIHDERPNVVHPPELFVLAAVKVAAKALKTHRKWWQVDISQGDLGRLYFPVKRCEVGLDRARSAVVVDANEKTGDSCESEVYVEVSWLDMPGVQVDLGKGIDGVIAAEDRPSLIRMICTVIEEVLITALAERGVQVAVSVPW